MFLYILFISLIRGEPERAPNTQETGSGYIYTCIYACGVIISVRKELIN